MMVMCNDIVIEITIIEHDEIRPGLHNEPLDMEYENYSCHREIASHRCRSIYTAPIKQRNSHRCRSIYTAPIKQRNS